MSICGYRSAFKLQSSLRHGISLPETDKIDVISPVRHRIHTQRRGAERRSTTEERKFRHSVCYNHSGRRTSDSSSRRGSPAARSYGLYLSCRRGSDENCPTPLPPPPSLAFWITCSCQQHRWECNSDATNHIRLGHEIAGVATSISVCDSR